MPMRPTSVRLSAAGFSPWIPINRMSDSFGIGFGVKLSSGASLTYSVQHTFDDIYAQREDLTISRSTTTATVTMVNHGLSVGDWIYISNAGAPFDGFFAVAAVTNLNVFTYTVLNSGATAASLLARIQTARVFEHAVVTAKTASLDGSYLYPPRAIRLAVTTYSSGFADLNVIAAGK